MRITASQLYSYLTCPHRVVMDATGDPAERDPVSPFVQLLWERGTAHEREVMSRAGRPFLDLSALQGEAKEAATREAIARREPLIYSGRLSVHELLGEPDLLRLRAVAAMWPSTSSPARQRKRPMPKTAAGCASTYGVQLALYTDILARMGLSAGRYGYIWDVHRVETRYDLDAPLGARSPSPVGDLSQDAGRECSRRWRRPPTAGRRLPVDCKQCVWRSACFRSPEKDRRSHAAAGAGSRQARCIADGVPDAGRSRRCGCPHITSTDRRPISPASAPTCCAGSSAALRCRSRPVRSPISRVRSTGRSGHVELFFDIETDPMRDLCYLHGFVIRERVAATGEQSDSRESSLPIFQRGAERDAFAAAMALFRRHPDALVVHYSQVRAHRIPQARRANIRMSPRRRRSTRCSCSRARSTCTCDVVKTGSEWPTHDFSIKSLAKHCGFHWRDADPSGASSIEWFDQWAKTGDPRLRQRLLDYNEDDCRAMRVVLDVVATLPVRLPENIPARD